MTPNEAVEAIRRAKSDEDTLRIEEQLIVQTDNRPHDGDPVQPEESNGDS